jgi:two-component system phosphate regulon response regulator PhoB
MEPATSSPVRATSQGGSDRSARDLGSGPGRGLETGTRRRPRALIVEDHEDTREIYAWGLRASGWHVEVVSSGADALAFAADFDPDVVVMDLHLPGLGGIEATKILRRDVRTSHIPVVACTAYGNEHQREMQEVGFDQFVPKPCTPEELRIVLEELLSSR